MSIISFPAAPPPAEPVPDGPRARALVGLPYIGAALNMPSASAATLKRVVADLVEAHGFPLPNPRRWKGRLILSGAHVVTAGSRWNRDQVDSWLASRSPDGRTPGGAAQSVAAEARARQVDHHVARQLRLIAGGRA